MRFASIEYEMRCESSNIIIHLNDSPDACNYVAGVPAMCSSLPTSNAETTRTFLISLPLYTTSNSGFSCLAIKLHSSLVTSSR